MLTPSEKILQKALVSSTIDSSQWNGIQAGLRDRAFFSSRVESLRYLQEARTRIADQLAAAKTARGTFATRADTVSAIMARARSEKINTGAGGLTDPGSAQRAAVIADTNAGLAAGYVRRADSMSYGSRVAFPGQELIRVRPSAHPRGDWAERFTAAGGQILGGRMIALIDSPVWASLSRFGQPYPPFDYGSGMGVRAVSREDCIDLGLIPEDYDPPRDVPDAPAFNDGLSAEVPFRGKADPGWNALKEIFADQIVYSGGRVEWRSDLVRNAAKTGQGTFRLGKAQQGLMSKLPLGVDPSIIEGKSLSLSGDWLSTHAQKHKADDGKKNMPMTDADLDLIPELWRNPDKVECDPKHAESILVSMDTFDGGTLKLGIDCFKGPRPTTFRKERTPAR